MWEKLRRWEQGHDLKRLREFWCKHVHLDDVAFDKNIITVVCFVNHIWGLCPNQHTAAQCELFSEEMDLNAQAERGGRLVSDKESHGASCKFSVITPTTPTLFRHAHNHTPLLSARIAVRPASNLVSVFFNKVSSDKHDGEPLCFRAGYSENDLTIKYCRPGRWLANPN